MLYMSRLIYRCSFAYLGKHKNCPFLVVDDCSNGVKHWLIAALVIHNTDMNSFILCAVITRNKLLSNAL